MTSARAISTVADVSIALLVVAVCIGVLVTGLTGGTETHDPVAAAHTAETLGTSTVAVNYSLAPVLAAADSERVSDPGEYEDGDLRRVSHAPALGHLARAATLALGFKTPAGWERVVPFAYESQLDGPVQASLVASSFETNATAVWEPFDNASVRGTASVGPTPPHNADTSLVRMTVPSEFPSVRTEAMAAVEGDDEYSVVADIVATAVIEGQFPLAATQRVLEGDGPERDVAVARYLNTADLVAGTSRGVPAIAENLDREDADAAVLNNHLADHLATQLEAELAATFDTPTAAARAVSTGEVTVSITTWETTNGK
jgi:hypothetical protein